MVIEIKQELRLAQQLVMTPQLQQAIKLLQLSRLELQEVVTQELNENPMLEDETPYGEEMKGEAAAQETDQPTDHDWDEYRESHGISTYSSGGTARADSDEAPWENLATRQATLSDYLRWQLRMAGMDAATEEIGVYLIGNIDEDGYLRESVEGAAGALGVPAVEVERVVGILQAFEPAGVCARGLQECLMIQLQALPERDALAEAIVEHHLSDLKKRDYRILAKALQVTVPEVVEAVKVISGLEPRPGRPYSSETASVIVPDVFVYKVEGDYVVVLNDDGFPRLRINSYYRELLEDKRDNVPRDYLREKFKSAMWLLRSIQQRQDTLFKVTRSIVKFQREFLEHGIDRLQPLVLRDVADDIEMHESTVSRVTTNKYAHTPQGVYELKFFFSGRIGEGSEEVAVKKVKNLIKQLISDEDQKRPLSDERIAQLLNEQQNISIARRTVAKYRDSMKILPSSDRKRMW